MRIDQVNPRCDMVLVRRVPDAEVLASGLILPAICRDYPTGVRIGEVLMVGPGDATTSNLRRPMECRVGDRILYSRCPDNDVTIDGVPCVLLREEQHVLAILEAA